MYGLDEYLQCCNISLRRENLRGVLKNISQGETLKGEELRDLWLKGIWLLDLLLYAASYRRSVASICSL